MSKLICFILLAATFSCVKEAELRTTYYSFENQTDKDLVVEFWNYNSGQFVSLQDRFTQNGKGVFANKCVSDNSIPGPKEIYAGDSIIIKFNNEKKLTYLWNFSNTDDPIFFSGSYRREPGTNNFFWDVTEEDFNNAVPYYQLVT